MKRNLHLGLTAGVICTTIALGTGPSALAQSDTGRVVGTVTDATGAAIPGAAISVTNVDNGSVLNATSNESGEFNIPAVPRGNYRVTVTASGFQSQQQSFTLAVTQNQTLLFKLPAGT